MAQDYELLKQFLNKFNKEKLNELSLNEYTNTGERDDFTYWVEIKLDCFGGIKGGNSFKFGVYKCNKKPDLNRDGYEYDKNCQYAWVKKYGNTFSDAFKKIKGAIVKIVNAASKKGGVDFEDIEKTELGETYKWKIAFLYSDYQLIPVYQKKALITAAKRLKIQINEKPTIAQLQKSLVEYYKDNQKDFRNDICSFGAYVWKIGTSDLSLSNQIIKYGAPGTGKTYTAKIDAEEYFDIWKLDSQNTKESFSDHFEFVQFHPSYSYEDFIEGIKPVIENGKTELKLKNGIFKSFCKEAAKYELWLLNNSDKKLCDITVKDVKELNGDNNPFVFPDDVKDDALVTQYIPPYFFVIDEINRADLSRVFGELMYCLEYRGYEGRIKTQYSEMESGDTIFYEDNNKQRYFFIPNNVYIIGTMNTIDRSIESFDFALRRRFLWQRVDPDKKELQKYFDKNDKTELGNYIIPLWEKLNKEIANNTQLLGEDYQIGHSYLMKLDKYPDCTKTEYRNIVWEKHIRPVIEEYFRGMGGEAISQIEKLRKIFCANPNTQKQKGKDAVNPVTSTSNEAKDN